MADEENGNHRQMRSGDEAGTYERYAGNHLPVVGGAGTQTNVVAAEWQGRGVRGQPKTDKRHSRGHIPKGFPGGGKTGSDLNGKREQSTRAIHQEFTENLKLPGSRLRAEMLSSYGNNIASTA